MRGMFLSRLIVFIGSITIQIGVILLNGETSTEIPWESKHKLYVHDGIND